MLTHEIHNRSFDVSEVNVVQHLLLNGESENIVLFDETVSVKTLKKKLCTYININMCIKQRHNE